METVAGKHQQEFYGKWYAVEVFANPLPDGGFAMNGYIRHAIKNPTIGNDLPFQYQFGDQSRAYKSADEAVAAGIGFARKQIDALR